MRDDTWKTYLVIICTAIFFCFTIYAAAAPGINEASYQESKIITIAEKIPSHGKDGKYLVIDTNENVYCVSDNMFINKFDASDRYASLHINSTYSVVIGGYRNHFWTWYPNILEIKEVK
jgi:hypothetical protein